MADSPGKTDKDAANGTRPAKPGDTDNTRFGMEEGDDTDVSATGLNPEQQSPAPDDEPSR